jgi:hypothetical protein
MKQIIFLSLIISLIIGSCTQQEIKSSNEGAWKVVSWKSMKGDTVTMEFPGKITGSEMKIISNNNFLWVGRYKSDTTFFDNYGGGTIKIDGNHVEETELYCVDQSAVGSTIRILWEEKNDTATQSWPCDEKWQLKKDNYFIQKWVRIK